jgi:thioredoxin-dependent peroxiredoxin
MGAQVLAISADDMATQQKFKAELEATFPFIADADAKLIELYDVKLPVLTLANRTTFVIDKSRKIVSVTTGGDAVDPTAALGAATLSCGG